MDMKGMTAKQVRDSFWETQPHEYRSLRRAWKKQNDYPTDVRCAFVDYVDHLRRNGQITERMAQRITL